ncbi:hypothetical protein MMC25_001008 [Agyrium rufum]|nr:hypothetical protein [Agyrium rufum]
MGTTDNIAIVALIVSLIALLIALLQLLQQLFGTAEGYRRCAESVIGVWHKTRKRRFVLWELRFETRYVTPQIVLCTPRDIQEARQDFDEVHLLHSVALGTEEYQLLRQTIHPPPSIHRRSFHWLPLGRNIAPSSSSSTEHNTGGHEASHIAGTVLRQRNRHAQGDPEKAASSHGNHGSTDQKVTSRRHESELLVSWLRLLSELHTLYASYWPKDCNKCQPRWAPMDSSDTPHSLTLLDEVPKGDNIASTDVTVIYRKWNWAFMPPEMTRPLALINLGDVIILAFRMNMRWRALDLENGRLQADGNGYGFSSAELRGLGTVLRFTASGSHDRFPRYIPSRAQDKMIFGIVPGCPDFVDEDFGLIGNDGKPLGLDCDGGILARIGVSEEQRNLHRKRNWSETHNEVIILLCPFLPLPDSTIASFYFPAWAQRRTRSVFRFWEARAYLKQALGERCREKSNEPNYIALNRIFKHFEHLHTVHRDDIYHSTAILGQAGLERKKQILADCREIHDWTTFALKGKANGTRIDFSERDDISHLPHYVHLVAAHACMTMDAIQDAIETLKSQIGKGKDRSQRALRKEYGFETGYGDFLTQELYLIGKEYVRHVTKPDSPIGDYLRSKGVYLSDSEAEIAWWLLMLRGLTWAMSTVWESRSNGDPVPSSIYGDQTPIWIT